MTSKPTQPRANALKRIVDIAIAACCVPVAIPVLATACAAIRMETNGNPIFRQTRVGRDGVRFDLLKLRTMVENAETIGAGIYAEPNDPRFTRVGVFLRRTSLDELPQLVNIFRGEMSIVGPRPMLPITVEEYQDHYDEILRVKPGITGLSQISGRNNLTRSERLAFDRQYASEWTLLMDFQILLRTLKVVLRGEGQRNDQGKEDVEQ